MKTSKSSKLSAFLIIVMMMFMMVFLTSCEGYTWKYHTTIQYHYEGETETHVVTHDLVVSYNSSVEEISVQAFANSFNNGHNVELVYNVWHDGVIQENRSRASYYKYLIMQVPDKSVLIDKVETVRTLKTK